MLEFSTRPLNPNDLFALRHVHDARLSPDGGRVVLVISRTVEERGDELFEIEIEELVTGEKHRLLFPGCATFPRWSPDGSRLVFVGVSAGVSRLYLSDANASEITALTSESWQV